MAAGGGLTSTPAIMYHGALYASVIIVAAQNTKLITKTTIPKRAFFMGFFPILLHREMHMSGRLKKRISRITGAIAMVTLFAHVIWLSS